MTIILGLCILFLASLITGMTGFGFALIAVPLLTLLLTPKVVVTTLLLLGLVNGVLILVQTWRWLKPRRIWPLLVGGVVGAPLGTTLLLALDADLLQALIGVVVVLSALALAAGLRWQVQDERRAAAGAGLLSGVLAGSTGIGGPPVILFFANQDIPKQVFRANITLFFLTLGISNLISQSLGGLVTRPVLSYTLWLLPALLGGTWLGTWLADRVSERLFRKITLILVISTGLSAIVSSTGLL